MVRVWAVGWQYWNTRTGAISKVFCSKHKSRVKTARNPKKVHTTVTLTGAPGLDTVLSPVFQTVKPLIHFTLYLEVKTTKSSNAQRDEAICHHYAEGESISDLACAYAISPQRIFQIVQNIQRQGKCGSFVEVSDKSTPNNLKN